MAEQSFHRHVRYCGTRTRNRPQSCFACNASKTKCSFAAPCIRCIKKGIQCVYKTSTAGSKHLLRPLEEDHVADVVRTLSPIGAVHHSYNEVPITTDFAFNDALPSRDQYGIDEFLALDGLLASEEFDVRVFSSSGLWMAPYEKLDTWEQSWCGWMHRGMSLSTVTENSKTGPKPTHAVSVPQQQSVAQHNADLIIRSVRAFPTMMLRRETFPWYIHKHSSMVFKPTQDSLPEPLSNCMSIAQMFSLRTPDTRTFLWRTIRAEYRRLGSEV